MKIITGLAAGVAAMAAGNAAWAITGEEIAAGFGRAVTEYCTPSVQQGSPLVDWPAAKLTALSAAEASARAFVKAEPTDTVWNITPGTGAVFIVQSVDGKCHVSTYGPPVRPTFEAVGARLTAAPLKLSSAPAPALPDQSIFLRFSKGGAADGVQVDLIGSEPGMPGHASRFSNMSAFVSRPQR